MCQPMSKELLIVYAGYADRVGKKVPKICDETKLNPTLHHVLEIVEKQLRIMNDSQHGHSLMTKRKPLDSKNKPLKQLPSNQISTMAMDFRGSNLCPCGKGKHSLTNSESFVKKTPEGRWKIVKKCQLCPLCLASGHIKALCRSTTMCKCRATYMYKHRLLLHRIVSAPKDSPNPQSHDRKSINISENRPKIGSENQESALKVKIPKSHAGKTVNSRQ